MISFQQNRPIQTLQKLFHSEGSTYTNTIKKKKQQQTSKGLRVSKDEEFEKFKSYIK